ncbi:MAG: glycosyltransferase [Bacteroidales bacterium]|jgi:glycosyltransferase involved in cell wall biosynthesis|nr:glycosyltransferase [Bacteroidales bacterium]
MYWLLTLMLPYLLLFLYLEVSFSQAKKRKETPGRAQGKKPLLLSLVIPFKNEAAGLPGLLDDLASQVLDPALFEIIFVDDGSTDAGMDILKSSPGELQSIKILGTGGKGKKKAMALGIENARGDYIVTTDADCRVSKDWLKEIYRELSITGADMLIGPVDIIDEGSLFNRLVQLEFLALQSVTEIFARPGKAVMCNAANMCFRNPGPARYETMVKTELPSGDDIFLMESFRREGRTIRWLESPGAMVMTKAPGSVRAFFRQRIRWTSKSPFYSDPLLLSLSVLVFLTNMLIVAVFIASFFFTPLWLIFVLLLLIKAIPDYPLLAAIAAKRGKRYLMSLFLPAHLLYPFYVSVSGLAGMIKGLFSRSPAK